MRFPFQMRLATGAFAAGLSVFIAVLWLAHHNILELESASLSRQRTYQVMAELQAAKSSAVDAETGTRGFVITGDERFLQPYEVATVELPRRFEGIRRLVSDDAMQRHLAAAELLVQARLALLAERVRLRREEGFEAASAADTFAKGKQVMDALRVAFGEMEREEESLLVGRDAAVQRQTRWVDVTLLAGALIGGLLLAYVFFALDREVGQRRQTEDETRRSEERLQAILDNMPALVFVKDHAGRLLFVNRRCEPLFHVKASEAKGKTDHELLPKEFADALSANDLEVLQRGEAIETEEIVQLEDGPHTYLSLKFPLREAAGSAYGLCGIKVDISERKRLEEERDRFFSLSQDLICTVGFDGLFKRVNPAWEQMLGHPAGQLIGVAFADFLHPDDRERTAAEFAEQLQHGKVVLFFENRYRRKDGTYRWLQWTSMPHAESGLIYAIARDVTTYRQIQDEVRGARDAAETANKELEAFSYSVSHDLRAPLRSIDGFSQALIEDYGDKLDAQGTDHLQRVRAAAQRMAQLIDDMLKLSRITRAELNPERLDVSALVSAVAEEVKGREPGRAAVIQVEPGLLAEADPRLLRVAIENLLSNAWKFTRKTPDALIEFGAERHNGSGPVYFFRDNGAGFDMAYASKLFGAFQRLHATRDFEGSGIGLATAARVIRRHGGRIWADAAPGHGATFYFTLGDQGQRPGEDSGVGDA